MPINRKPVANDPIKKYLKAASLTKDFLYGCLPIRKRDNDKISIPKQHGHVVERSQANSSDDHKQDERC